MVIISKEIRVYFSVEAFNSDLLTASFLEVSSYFPTFFDQINNVRWKTRFLVYCEGTFIGRLSLITEKSNSLIILSNIMLFSFSPTQPICFVLAFRSPPKM
ncbi:hypothetical protein BpHYR1_013610 [Brachionus plicatilis]|uniref:Uncharacterized protein n=1 Tax=Brachionus plicatilis TaxID=10195 RepID=A0A3M7R9E2_BRAPC|nr:hypothetical protein BpHYR1_013610 [Brachionus plicatilis]